VERDVLLLARNTIEVDGFSAFLMPASARSFGFFFPPSLACARVTEIEKKFRPFDGLHEGETRNLQITL
jgi:hypothetical protein